ncbi:hypothetical protein DICSQDRAFT_55910 [Dichomitus squalens LYAD-421 SS1]|uniref:uncharacterized protein n=1 Tax=Dichomitus squalens (strain LYAD-421) TaxID=732165 RepID=UPI00044136CB|nr:uncharacterized protein DICSQDRAFT_55910 [Dichomitus squalens LYAD-421 SS1]EJF63217.1 hypothetical protein DICSQDRAFT_55910 [Dichomitus squalens LYAD-421 SS1]
MSEAEPQWEKRILSPQATEVYTRPLLASEHWCDQTMLLMDGISQFASGVQFTTSIPKDELEARVKEAVSRLRFECPLVGATFEAGVHDPDLRSWIYAPVENVEQVRSWADKMVYYLPDSIDPASFLQVLVEKKIPYTLADGTEQYLRVFVTRPDGTLNTFCLFLHTSHAIMDAKPSLNVLSLLLEYMSTPGLIDVADLPWGTEHKNLLPGVVTATGGPHKDWEVHGPAMLEKFQAFFAKPKPSHSLACDTLELRNPGKLQRFVVTFTAQESAKIAQALKTLGFTFSELIDAATALATLELNPIPDNELEGAHIDVGGLIAINDRLPPNIDRRRHIVSCMVNAPLAIYYAPLAKLTGKPRLLAAMKQAKEQYDDWLANPCLPHLAAELARLAPMKTASPPSRSPFATNVTNVGRVENYIAPVWPRDVKPGEVPVFRVEQMHLTCRLTWPMP